jgi:hypothetical protein
MVWAALGWGLLSLLPFLPAIVESRPAQVRVFALSMAPLLMASTAGMALFVDRLVERKVHWAMPWIIGSTVVAGIALSQAESYSVLRGSPGGWRLQYIKEWLSPPKYERVSYPLDDLQAISQYAYGDSSPKVIIIEHQRNEEMLGVIYYLRPVIEEGAAGAAPMQRTYACGRDQDLRAFRVMLCLTVPNRAEVEPLGADVRMYYLRRLEPDARASAFAGGEVVFRAGELALVDAKSVDRRTASRPAPKAS